MPVEPEPGVEVNDCFYGVAQRVKRDGGEAICGWAIWIWPQVWITAEHHAVWRQPDASLLDITPKLNHAKQIVFLPDPERTYDFQANRRLDNVQRPLRSDPTIPAYFAAKRQFFEFEEEHPQSTGLEMHLDPAEMREYVRLKTAEQEAFMRVVAKYMGPNDLCFCHSGKKAKRCHLGR